MNKDEFFDSEAYEWLNENELSYDIWNKKYRFNNESFSEWVERVSGGEANIAKLIKSKKFLFGGRILANRGVKDTKITLSNCYVIQKPEDNLESIFECCSKLARTYSYGGGCGIDISYLRPNGSVTHNAAKKSSGPVSFMDLFSQVTGTISQSGRRGALMISMSINHPDIEEFIDCKTDLNKVNYANISVRINDEFMKAVENDDDYILHWPCGNKKLDNIDIPISTEWEYNTLYTIEDEKSIIYAKKIKAKPLFEKLAKNNWAYAEPGILYWDRITNYNMLSNNEEFEYGGVNPCITGDAIIQTEQGEITLKELVEKYEQGEKIKVLSFNIEKNKAEYKEVYNALLTRHNANIIEIEDEEGNLLKLTPDHKVYTENRGWVEASKLSDSDIIMKFSDIKTIIIDDIKLYSEFKKIRIKRIRAIENEDVYDISVKDNHNFFANDILVHNCAEEPLPAGGSCLLGSLNLSEFVKNPFTENAFVDFKELEANVAIAVEALNDVLIEGMPLHPLAEQRESVNNWRQIGLGTMGLADMLIKLGIKYGSKESLDIIEKVYKTIAVESVCTSSKIAMEDGESYPNFNEKLFDSEFIKHLFNVSNKNSICKKMMANSQLLTCAPTGSIATMLGISTGVEPIYAMSYNRTTKSLNNKDTVYKVYTPIAEEYLREHEDLPEYFVESAQISPMDRIKVQAKLQEFTDAAISSTINLPKETTVEEIYNIYMEAWKHGLKGVTVFRSGCSRQAILSTEETTKTEEFAKRPKTLEGEIFPVKVKGEQFAVILGYMNGKPYEIFAIRPTDGVSQEKGRIIKRAKRHYSFKSENISIDNILETNINAEENTATLYISQLLRHNVPIKYIIKTAKKAHPSIVSFTSAICRILDKFLDLETLEERCPICGGKMIKESGCMHCENGDYSKCGD